jgi:tRNA-2-methylthio-N6-dimethylallyladenosine synthase
VEESRFDQAFMFIFSPRPGTRASEMTDHFVPAAEIKDRFDRLVEVQSRISLEANRARVGRVEEILIEGPSKRDAGVVAARTRGGKLVHVAGTWPAGTFFSAEIVGAAPHHLVGRPI